METKTRIIFRADGNSQIGLGHVVRSLALAEMLRHEFECVFAIQDPDPELREQIKQTCEGIIILPACSPDEDRFTHELEAYIASDVIVVLDGYHFGTAYQQRIKRRGSQLFCIDDIHSYAFVADAVLNQAGSIEEALYNKSPYTKLLLGPQYALLRPPFLRAAKAMRAIPSGDMRLLLNLGGADPDNYTLRIAKELEHNTTINKIEIVVGSAYRHLPELQEWIKDRQKFNLHLNLSGEEMCQLMQSCPVAVTSASGVAYEYASVGGLLYVLQTADNQAGLHSFIIGQGIGLPYKQLTDLSINNAEALFQHTVAAQRCYLDGLSDERLRQEFRKLALAASIHLRQASDDDLMQLFEWANDPEVRKNSFNTNTIPLQSHTRWFQTKLEDDQAKLYMAEAAGVPAAHIRFDMQDGKATISYLIGPGHRGKGLGHVILQKGVEQLLRQWPDLNVVEGLVQKANVASVRAFEKAGFDYATPDPKHPQAYRFELRVR